MPSTGRICNEGWSVVLGAVVIKQGVGNCRDQSVSFVDFFLDSVEGRCHSKLGVQSQAEVVEFQEL